MVATAIPCLPHAATVLIHHGRSCLAVKCLLEFRHVRNHAIGAVFLWRMRIDRGAHPLGFVAGFSTPALPIAHEESLLRSKAIERLQLLALVVGLPRHV